MSQLSNYAEGKLVEHLLGVASFTMPSTIYLALYTSDPTDANSGTELSGSGYARQTITFGTHSNGTSLNTSAETFTASGGNFGTITHIGLLDASTSGNLLCFGALAVSKTVNDGESISFAVGSISVTLA